MKEALLFLIILPLCGSFNILICVPGSIKSLHGFFANIAYESANQGHNVTFVTSYRLQDSHPNIHEVTYPKIAKVVEEIKLFEMRGDVDLQKVFSDLSIKCVQQFWSDQRSMSLWKQRNQFDIFMTFSHYSEMTFPYLMNFTGHFVQVSTTGVEVMAISREGNWLTSSVAPSMLMNYDDHMNFWERSQNLIGNLFLYSFEQSMMYEANKYVLEYFPDFGDPSSYYDRVAMTLINGHFALDGPIPLLPSQIEIGTINARKPKPLPQDFESFAQGSGDAGIIYFSLGTVAKSSDIPKDAKVKFIEAFKRIPQRVLWKYEGNDLELPENVKSQKWMPQQDILGHPKTRLFISHCGNLGTQEAKYHGVPVLAAPIAFDQPRNAARMVRKGYALALQWEDLTTDMIVEAINTLINDTSYKDRLEAISLALHDQKDTPAERAVWWLEYLVRHKGAPHLQYAGKRLSLFQYVMLDVIFFWLFVLLAILFIFVYAIKVLCCSSKNSEICTKKKRQ